MMKSSTDLLQQLPHECEPESEARRRPSDGSLFFPPADDLGQNAAAAASPQMLTELLNVKQTTSYERL